MFLFHCQIKKEHYDQHIIVPYKEKYALNDITQSPTDLFCDHVNIVFTVLVVSKIKEIKLYALKPIMLVTYNQSYIVTSEV